jgi:uncharacterized membrane protein YidH (DUF202 family)
MSADPDPGPSAELSAGLGDDPAGLQKTRTALAWRRTALSLCGATVVLVKVALPRWGEASVGCLLAGVGGALALFWASTRHYRARLRAEAVTASRTVLLTTVMASLITATAGCLVLGR